MVKKYNLDDFEISYRYPQDKNGKYIETPFLKKYSGTDENVTLPENLMQFGDGYPDKPICEMSSSIISSAETIAALKVINIPGSYRTVTGFEGCVSLKRVYLNAPTSEIDRHAFYGCTSLEEIILPDTLKKINGYSAFYGCSSLESIKFPASLKSIGTGAFENCSSLKSVTFEDGIEVICNCAFEGCSSLEEIHLPKSLKALGPHAFRDCTSLKTVHIHAEHAVKMGMGIFYGVPSGLKVIFGGSSEEWKKSIERIVIEPEYPTMYGEYGSVTIEEPLGHPLTFRFEIDVYCEKDGISLKCHGLSESTQHICH